LILDIQIPFFSEWTDSRPALRNSQPDTTGLPLLVWNVKALFAACVRAQRQECKQGFGIHTESYTDAARCSAQPAPRACAVLWGAAPSTTGSAGPAEASSPSGYAI